MHEKGGRRIGGDLISRSAAIDIINEERRFIESLRETVYDNEDRAHNTGELGCAIRLARKIKELPALDVAQVVRCRDCSKRKTNRCPMYFEEFEAVDSYDGYWFGNDQTKDDGFCQCGEKWRRST